MTRYPKSPSCSEMEQAKPRKKGRNTAYPRPFRPFSTFEMKGKNREQRRAEIFKRGISKTGGKPMRL